VLHEGSAGRVGDPNEPPGDLARSRAGTELGLAVRGDAGVEAELHGMLHVAAIVAVHRLDPVGRGGSSDGQASGCDERDGDEHLLHDESP